MSKAEVDFRGKVTVETDAWLEAEFRVTGASKQEIVRDVLHQYALKKIHAAKVLAALAPAEGASGAGGGKPR